MKYTKIIKRETKVMIGVVVVLMVVVLGVSYALFMQVNSNTNNQVVTTGTLQVEYASENGYINGTTYKELVPMSDEDGLTQSGYSFSIKNTGSLDVNYQVYLYVNYIDYNADKAAGKISGDLFEDLSLIKYSINTNDTGNSEIKSISDITKTKIEDLNSTYKGVTKYYLYTGNINGNATNYHKLKMWLNEESETDIIGKYVYLKLEVNNYVKSQGPKVSTLTTDENGNGKADIGDLITVGTESFYVYSNDETNIKAIAQYNLNVGDNPYNTADGLQNENVVGYKSGYTTYGNVAFDQDSSTYAGSDIEVYVNDYKTKLEELGATINSASLITIEELEALGCSFSDYRCTSAPGFVYETSYWSGSAFDTSDVWGVLSDDSFGFINYNNVDYCGVRPVITISANEIN